MVFCFAVKGGGAQPAEVAQTVTEAVATPSIEVTQETTEEVSEPEVEVAEEPEVVEEAPVVEETSETEGSIVDVAETTEEDENIGVPTQKEEVSSEQVAEPKQEEVKPAETKPVETQPQQTQPQQTTVDAQRDAILAQAYALGATDGITESTRTIGDRVSNVGLQWE